MPYGYVKYRAPFNFNGEPKMFISTRADDAKKVFVNGKFVAEASNREKLTDFPLAQVCPARRQPGGNFLRALRRPELWRELGRIERAGIGRHRR